MQVNEIIMTCSHRQIANAVLLSIGGDFLTDVKLVAHESNMDAGTYAAEKVREFSRTASAHDYYILSQAILDTDQPILTGFRHIIGN